MKNFKFKVLIGSILTLGIFLSSFAERQSKNTILFYAIDDWVEVYVDGELVFEKAASSGQIGESVEFDLNPFIKQKTDPVVEIRLMNALCTTCDAGNGWIIEFEIFQNDESVDYIIEEGDSLGGDTVFSIKYDWGYI